MSITSHATLHEAVREALAHAGVFAAFRVSTVSTEQHPGRLAVEWGVDIEASTSRDAWHFRGAGPGVVLAMLERRLVPGSHESSALDAIGEAPQ